MAPRKRRVEATSERGARPCPTSIEGGLRVAAPPLTFRWPAAPPGSVHHPLLGSAPGAVAGGQRHPPPVGEDQRHPVHRATLATTGTLHRPSSPGTRVLHLRSRPRPVWKCVRVESYADLAGGAVDDHPHPPGEEREEGPEGQDEEEGPRGCSACGRAVGCVEARGGAIRQERRMEATNAAFSALSRRLAGQRWISIEAGRAGQPGSRSSCRRGPILAPPRVAQGPRDRAATSRRCLSRVGRQPSSRTRARSGARRGGR